MPKEDNIEVLGQVVEKFKAGMFSVEIDAGKKVLAAMAGRLRRNRIKIMNGLSQSLSLRCRLQYDRRDASVSDECK